MWKLAKSLDPTRLIEDMSVVEWDHLEHFAHGATDVNSWHFYSRDYYKAKAHIERGRAGDLRRFALQLHAAALSRGRSP